MLGKILARIRSALAELWAKEPVAVTTTVASLVVFIAGSLGIVVPRAEVLQALADTLPILFGGAIARGHVSPTGKG